MSHYLTTRGSLLFLLALLFTEPAHAALEVIRIVLPPQQAAGFKGVSDAVISAAIGNDPQVAARIATKPFAKFYVDVTFAASGETALFIRWVPVTSFAYLYVPGSAVDAAGKKICTSPGEEATPSQDPDGRGDFEKCRVKTTYEYLTCPQTLKYYLVSWSLDSPGQLSSPIHSFDIDYRMNGTGAWMSFANSPIATCTGYTPPIGITNFRLRAIFGSGANMTTPWFYGSLAGSSCSGGGHK